MTLKVNIFPIPQPQENFYRCMMGNQIFFYCGSKAYLWVNNNICVILDYIGPPQKNKKKVVLNSRMCYQPQELLAAVRNG